MAQWVLCPRCDQHYQFPDAAAGKQASCPKCGAHLTVGAPPAPAVPPPPRVPPVREAAPPPLWALPVAQNRREPAAAPRTRPAPPPTAPHTAGAPNTYHHDACGGDTTISPDYVAWMTGDPFSFVLSSKCGKCRRYVGLRALVWKETGENVAAYRKRLRRQMHPLLIALRLAGGPLIGALLGAAVGALANLHNLDLGVLAGVLIGLPLGWFVTGLAFQIVWSLRRAGSR